MSHVGAPCRYQKYDYNSFREKAGISKKRTYERYQRLQRFFLSRGFEYRAILAYALDNPFSTTDAKRVMLNEYYRYGENGFRRRR